MQAWIGSGRPGALLLLTISVAGLHALIPSHWLAFAVVGRAQRWPVRRTLTVAFLAGTGHVVMTTVFGIVLASLGKTLLWKAIPPSLEHGVTAVLLIGLGFYFAAPNLKGHGGCHHHGHNHTLEEAEGDASEASGDHPEAGDVAADGHGVGGSRLRRMGSEPTVMGALVLGLTLSPCLDLLSVYVAASSMAWSMILFISVVMGITTLLIMLTLIWLTLHGLQRLNLRWLEHNEGLAVGGILIALGILLFFV